MSVAAEIARRTAHRPVGEAWFGLRSTMFVPKAASRVFTARAAEATSPPRTGWLRPQRHAIGPATGRRHVRCRAGPSVAASWPSRRFRRSPRAAPAASGAGSARGSCAGPVGLFARRGRVVAHAAIEAARAPPRVSSTDSRGVSSGHRPRGARRDAPVIWRFAWHHVKRAIPARRRQMHVRLQPHAV